MFLMYDHDMRPLLNLCSCPLLQTLEFHDLIATISFSLYYWKMCLSHLLVNSTSVFFIGINHYGQISLYYVHNLTSHCLWFWLYIGHNAESYEERLMWWWKLMSRRFYWTVLSAWVRWGTVCHCPSGYGSEVKVMRRGSYMRFGRQSWRSHDSVLCTVRRHLCMGT